eukprot:scaffold105005_cov60-Phaeocystis_antarctica.AAC.1
MGAVDDVPRRTVAAAAAGGGPAGDGGRPRVHRRAGRGVRRARPVGAVALRPGLGAACRSEHGRRLLPSDQRIAGLHPGVAAGDARQARHGGAHQRPVRLRLHGAPGRDAARHRTGRPHERVAHYAACARPRPTRGLRGDHTVDARGLHLEG